MLLNSNFIYQVITSYIPLIINILSFLFALYAYIWKPHALNKILKWSIGIICLWYVVKAGYFTWLQYITWKDGDLSKFFLPPYQSIAYFIQYSWTHFFMKIVWFFGGAGILGSIVLFLNVLLRKKITNNVDVNLVVFGSLLVGWPQMFVFFAITLLMSLCASFFYGIIFKEEKRISLAFFFFVAIVITFFFGDYLVIKIGLNQLIV